MTIEKTKTEAVTKLALDTLNLKVFVITGILGAFFVGMGFVVALFGLQDSISNLSMTPLVIEDPCDSIITSFNGTNAENIFNQLENSICRKVIKEKIGILNVMDIDDFDNMVSEERYYLVSADTTQYQIYFVNLNGSQFSTNQQINITLKGYLIGDNLLVDFDGDLNDNTNFQIDESRGALDMDPIFGEQTTAVLLLDFEHLQQPDFSVDDAVIYMDTVQDFYVENSYQKIEFTGVIDADVPADINGRYSIPMSSCEATDYLTMIYETMDVADDDFDFTQYSRIILIVPHGCQSHSPHRGPRDYTTPDGEGSFTIAISDRYGINQGADTISHELGHNFGNPHASGLECNVLTTPVPECSIEEYGDAMDIMGWGFRHNNTKYKEWFGWLDEWDESAGVGNIITISEAGEYIYTLEPIETISNGLKAIKIQDAGEDYMYIEYREAIGFDEQTSSPQVFNGALMHYNLFITSSHNNRSGLFDPDGVFASLTRTPSLEEGNSFVDPETKINITTLSVDRDEANPEDSRITVQINIPIKCSDGTIEGECNMENMYCDDDGELIEHCTLCGCTDANCVLDNNDGSYYCSNCALQGGRCQTWGSGSPECPTGAEEAEREMITGEEYYCSTGLCCVIKKQPVFN